MSHSHHISDDENQIKTYQDTSEHTFEKTFSNKDANIIEKEKKETGIVSMKVYIEFFKNLGIYSSILIFFLMNLTVTSYYVAQWWLSKWASANDQFDSM